MCYKLRRVPISTWSVLRGIKQLILTFPTTYLGAQYMLHWTGRGKAQLMMLCQFMMGTVMRSMCLGWGHSTIIYEICLKKALFEIWISSSLILCEAPSSSAGLEFLEAIPSELWGRQGETILPELDGFVFVITFLFSSVSVLFQCVFVCSCNCIFISISICISICKWIFSFIFCIFNCIFI